MDNSPLLQVPRPLCTMIQGSGDLYCMCHDTNLIQLIEVAAQMPLGLCLMVSGFTIQIFRWGGEYSPPYGGGTDGGGKSLDGGGIARERFATL